MISTRLAVAVILIVSLAMPAVAQTPPPFPFPTQSQPAPDFDEREFYKCASAACSVAMVMGFLFGPASFAAGCTAGMLSCAMKTALLDINNPQEIAAFLEVFTNLCQRQIVTTGETPQPLPASGF